jgi:hypothetical protein
MATKYGLMDPITRKSYDYTLLTAWEEHLYSVLSTVLDNQCPPDSADYLCERSAADVGNELLQCAECYRQWANKNAGAKTSKAKRLLQAIELAAYDRCPADVKDMLCKATEDESTDEETCKLCIQRWATIPFAEFRK